MTTTLNRVRASFFLDSVALMRISRGLAERTGVEDAALMMGTPANREIMAEAGLLDAQGEAAGGGDLVLAVRADDAVTAEAALDEAEALLARPKTAGGQGTAWRPRSLRAALRSLPAANLALISVPGDFAAAEARKALRRGLHVMIFSDNVSLEDEVALKQEASERGLLVMGPDCGTAILAGVPLAFANHLPRGDIGLIGASGTGLQEVACLIGRAGGGLSHAIGVGGRDLNQAVGGLSTLAAMAALEADPQTRQIVLIAKPPDPEVATLVGARIAASTKPYSVCFIGGEATALPSHARQAGTLKAVAAAALGGLGPALEDGPAPQAAGAGRQGLLGLFCGGTLAAEAQVVLRAAGEAVVSNAPIPGVAAIETAIDSGAAGHRLIDLGEDRYTRGRPHPMIEPAVRGDHLAAALSDPALAVLLLDLVIGTGAHGDPAGAVTRCLSQHAGPRPLVVASVTGSDADPQNRTAQAAALTAAGVLVAPSNADAAELALACLRTSR